MSWFLWIMLQWTLGCMWLFGLCFFFFSQGIYPVMGLLGHMIVLFLVFRGTSILFSIMTILLSHKKEWSWVICKEVDEPRVYYTEWSKSEREKQILYFDAFKWSLEKLHRCTYLQGKNRDANIENSCVGKGAKWEVWWTGRLGLT